MQFIDIHGHYAWDIDDGIKTKEESYAALQLAKKNNICAIVATPHVVPGLHTMQDIESIRTRLQELETMAKEVGIQVFTGSELFLNTEYLSALQNDIFIPIENTSYLLVEFDVRKELGSSRDVEDYLYEVELKGYTPIIAHIERYFKNKIDVERIQELISNGYIIQVNASSLRGIHGKTIKNNAFDLIDQGLVHVIATDTHSADGRRIPCLQETFDLLSKKYDYKILKTLMHDNPIHILNNEECDTIEVKQSFFKNLLKRR